MSLANPTGPRLASALPTQSHSSQVQSHTDLLISLALHNWPALTYAIQNAWGGSPQLSKDKRDWLAGSISDLLSTDQLHDANDLEEVLLQVMLDEFEVVVDDGSAGEVAGGIWKGVQKVRSGDVSEVNDMYQAWQEKGDKNVQMKQVQEQDDGQDTDWDDDDDGDDGEEEWNGIQDGEDREMSEAPPLVEVSRKEKVMPEVDEDGFTKVVGKKKR